MQRLHLDYKQDKDISGAFEDSFIPDTIADNEGYSFPIRTVFAEHSETNYDKNPYTLADGNIPFRYEKAPSPSYNKGYTDLKWSVRNQGRIKLYLENICLLMRNKVLINGGKLENTKIIWFYPVSMTEAHSNKLKTLWHTLYKDYFGNGAENNIIFMSESVAPYSYYSKKQGASSNVVTIDIGGGTTDVYVVEESKPKMLTSFRFASNAIFGDGYNWDSDNNGFIKTFKDDFLNKLATNGLDGLKSTFDSIENKKVSSDIVAFLFALSSNREVNNNEALDFLKKLSDNNRLKYVFILFYTAILYFVAHSMKAKGLKKPLTIAFSGNGSKTLRVLSDNNKTLAKYVKLIFESVFDEKYDEHSNLDIKFADEPKQVTCKGGILHPVTQDFDKIDDIKCTLIGYDMETFAGKDFNYLKITPDVQKKIVQAVTDFVTFTFDLHKNNGSFFAKKFDADAGIAGFVQNTCLNNLTEYAKLGLIKKQGELKTLGEEDVIEETLFFYPIVGMLNNLAREIGNLP
jgi:hypothetical protein